MQRLELDFRRARLAPGWAGYALLAVALAFAADLALSYRSLSAQVAGLEAKLLSVPARSPGISASASRPGADEYLFARDTVRRLSTPWESLFATLEAAHSERVALLAIEPDAEAGTVSISGEARDYLAALTYVANLAEQKTLRRVHLVRHEPSRAGTLRPVAFTVSASWREKP
jgi:hypothetical protein